MSQQVFDIDQYPILVLGDYFDNAEAKKGVQLPKENYVQSIDKAFFYDKSLKGDIELLRRRPLKCEEV